jgi:thiol-disulfide isomerase/thioredoxin
MTMSGSLHMPPLGGAAGWLNSPPVSPAELRGHPVVVNFWTLTCINWLRQEPYVRAWSRAYRGDGLVVIGVHTPEFFFEHDIDLVRQATKEREIDYPVAADNNYAIWNAFDNHYWPALYFIDSDGIIVSQHFGEGEYERSERVIQRLLGIDREPVAVEGRGVEAAADWDHLRSPETYLGAGRSEGFASPGGAVAESRLYRIPESLALNQWAVAGRWTIEQEKATLDHAGGSIAYRFQARDANLVMAPGPVMASGPAEPIPFRVLVDGQAPGSSHGVDTDADGNGLLGGGRMYQLVREQGEVLERTLEITFAQPGALAYVFTFG